MDDPLADPRSADLLAAVPDEVSALAAAFRAAAAESRATAAGLAAAQQDGTWAGRAAGAFRRAIGRLPGELERVAAGFEAVAQALTVYEADLAGTRTAYVRVVAELEGAQARLSQAQAVARAGASALTTAARARGARRRDIGGAELALARADGAVGGYESEIEQLRRRAVGLLEQFSQTRDVCRATIASAQRTAPVGLVPDRRSPVPDPAPTSTARGL